MVEKPFTTNVADAREIVESAHVDPTLYSFESADHEGLNVIAHGQTWHVFLSERGKRHEERTFENEDDACTDFLKRIFRLSRWQD